LAEAGAVAAVGEDVNLGGDAGLAQRVAVTQRLLDGNRGVVGGVIDEGRRSIGGYE
jgi:hypothetical protein